MKTTPKRIDAVEAYIKGFPPPIQAQLKQLRKAIRDVAPKAEEKISYHMPAYMWNGRLIYFAAWKHHIALYPMTTATIKAFKKEAGDRIVSKGTIQFPLDEKLPLTLIKKIVRFRMKENLENKKKK